MTKNAGAVPLWAQLGLSCGVVVLLCVILELGISLVGGKKLSQPAFSAPIALSQLSQTTKEESKVLVRPTPATQPSVAGLIDTRNQNYIIRSGDTLTSIARQHVTTIEEILRSNRGNPAIVSRDIIIAGKALTIKKGEKRTSPESVERKVHPEKSIERGGTSRAEFFVVPHSAKSPATTTSGKSVFPDNDCDAITAHASGRIVVKGRYPNTQQVLDCIETRYGQLMREAGRLVGLDSDLLKAVVYVESKGDPLAVSPSGCFGLMQLLKSTAVQYRVNTAWIHDPRENLFGGARILADYLRYARGDLNWALAAYNFGPTGVSRKVRSEGFVPSEARYVRAVRDTLTLLKG